MSDTLINLLHQLLHGITLETASADALFDLAQKAEATSRSYEASTLRSIARMHRAKVIEFQARLDALNDELDRAAASTDPSRS